MGFRLEKACVWSVHKKGSQLIARVKQKLSRLEQAVRDARASTELSRMGLKFRPWPASAIAPSALQIVLNEILINDRRTVVEFGSGLSTLYLAKALDGVGGRLVSVENNAEWAALVRTWLREEGLEGAVELIIAPMGPCKMGLGGLEWYDSSAVASAIDGLEIDCVLVDGPIAYREEVALSRYPALPLLKDNLAKQHAVFLDDASRAGEQKVLELWSDLLGIKFDCFPALGDIARGITGPAFESRP